MVHFGLQVPGSAPPITISKLETSGLRFALPVKGYSMEFLQRLTVLFVMVEPIVLQMFSLRDRQYASEHRPVTTHSSVAKRASKLDENKTRHLETPKVYDTIPNDVAGRERWLIRMIYASVDIQQLQTFMQCPLLSADDLDTELEFVQRSGAWYLSLGYLKDDTDVHKVEAWRVLVHHLLILADRGAPDFKVILSRIIQVRDSLAKRQSLRDCVKQLLEGLELEDVSYCLKLVE